MSDYISTLQRIYYKYHNIFLKETLDEIGRNKDKIQCK